MIARTATLLLLLLVEVAAAQTAAPATANGSANSSSFSKTNAPLPILTPAEEHAWALRGEEIRNKCIQNRRYVCGRILQILPDGLVVDSGYPRLLEPPLNRNWLVPGNAVVEKDPRLVEGKEPDSICVGLVFLSDLPKSRRRGKPKQYDYVVAHGYPAGERTYTSVGTVHHTVRRYSMGLENAVAVILQNEFEQATAAPARTGASVSEAK